ncbi:MAG: O-antigen ligase family protein [Sphingomonadales bacterium]|nr:O-antigen ligase family protein [Sphingomonadales bacterium]
MEDQRLPLVKNSDHYNFSFWGNNPWCIAIAGMVWALALILGLYAEQWWILLLPFALGLALLVIYRMDWALYALATITPLSILIDDASLGFAIQIPTDPLMIMISSALIMRWILLKPPSSAVLWNPITVFLGLWMLWMTYIIPVSSQPIVSVKFILSNAWKIIPCYFGAIMLFRESGRAIRFWWLYLIPLTFVAVWSLWHHAEDGFTKEASYWASEPFVINHGIYGAMLGFMIPLVILHLIRPYAFFRLIWIRPILLALLIVLVIAVTMSYTRAAWASLIAALGFYLFLLLKIQFRWLMLLAILATTLIAINSGPLLMYLMRNKTDSQDRLDKHLESISNVRSDASNLERLNRWASGFRMLSERPWMGWGPGTYMLEYAPFQNPYEKTIISTNNADVGGIHSEYFGPLIESGIPGFLFFVGILLASLQRGMSLWYRLKDEDQQRDRLILLCAMLGLVTYYTHGFFNNYLDMDKTAFLFWSGLALITSMDARYTSET